MPILWAFLALFMPSNKKMVGYFCQIFLQTFVIFYERQKQGGEKPWKRMDLKSCWKPCMSCMGRECIGLPMGFFTTRNRQRMRCRIVLRNF